MPSLKDVKNKITGVKKTKQITKAMNMVAASRLRGAQNKMEAFRPYSEKFGEVLGNLAARAGEESSSLLIPRDEVKNINIVLCTSDRGLCGGFNTNLIVKAEKFIKEDSKKDYSFTNFGKKGRDWCKREKFNILTEHLGIVGGSFNFNVASNIGQKLINEFLQGKYDKVFIIYSKFQSMAKQIPLVLQLLPIPFIEATKSENDNYMAEHICEPSTNELLEEILPKNIFVQIYGALLETSTSEHAARMMAMDNASKACDDMIENLTLAYNKARQAAVTTELMDIVGGAEALKG